jgi:hypothetical protein
MVPCVLDAFFGLLNAYRNRTRMARLVFLALPGIPESRIVSHDSLPAFQKRFDRRWTDIVQHMGNKRIF